MIFRFLKKIKGNYAEKEVAKKLKKEGCQILDRNIIIGGSELDIVAQKDDDLFFIEVKARTGKEFGHATEAITEKKAKLFAKGIVGYIASRKINVQNFNIRSCLAAVTIETKDTIKEIELIYDFIDINSAINKKSWIY
jgi:putative endonuclease